MKRLLLVTSGLLVAGAAQAQLGVRAGGNLLHTTTSSSFVNTRNGVGYQVGVYYQQPLTKRLSLVPEVQFSREQAQVHLDNYTLIYGQPVSSEYRLHLSYLNVPVLLRVALGPLYLEAGPQISLLMGGYGRGYTGILVSGTTTTTTLKADQAATNRFRRFNAGACVGVGLKLPAGLGLTVRAYQGFVPLERDYAYQENGLPALGTNQYRQTLQTSLTYQLHGG